MSSANDTIPQSPFCRNLRSKKYFFLQSMPLVESDMLDMSNHCWCRCTQQVVGPDGSKVRPNVCNAQRGCYESQFAETN
jgi:hypothetical protein